MWHLYFLVIHISIDEVYLFPAFPFPEFQSIQTIKFVSSRSTFTVLFLTIRTYFSFFMEHLNDTFEITLSCTLAVGWNYYVKYQTTQTGSRTTVTAKMELILVIFHSFYSLTIVTKISILDVTVVLDPIIIDIFALQRLILINFPFIKKLVNQF